MTIERWTDYEAIAAILRQPEQALSMGDDESTPILASIAPQTLANHLFVLVRVAGAPGALWGLAKRNAVLWEAHVCILPALRKPAARDRAFQIMLDWVWNNLPCERLISEIPACNWQAIRYARRNGAAEFGRNPKAWLKGGKLWDLVCMGIGKPATAVE
jgi:hypothetical protein